MLGDDYDERGGAADEGYTVGKASMVRATHVIK